MEELIDLYNSYLSIDKISKMKNISPYKVAQYLKKNGVNVTRRRCRTPIISNFFDVIDTEEKAYFLGLIGADGSISYNSNGKKVFSIELLTSDIDILNHLSVLLSGSTNLVKTYERTGRNTTSKIAFSDEVFISCLEKHGIIKDKSLHYDFPDIPKNLLKHFIRGYFDGDGSVYLSSKTTKISFTGSKKFIPKLNSILFNEEATLREYSITDKGNFCSIHFGGIIPSKMLYEYLYNESSIFLKRKKEKFESAPYFSNEISVSSKIGEG